MAFARKQAEQTAVPAQADNQKRTLHADADLARARNSRANRRPRPGRSQQRGLAGRGEASKVMQVGLSEASVLMRKISSFGDPRLYALSQVSEQLSHSAQPLVPERVFIAGGNGENGHTPNASSGMLGMLINLLVAEKSGFQLADGPEMNTLREFTDRMTREAMESIQQATTTEVKPAVIQAEAVPAVMGSKLTDTPTRLVGVFTANQCPTAWRRI